MDKDSDDEIYVFRGRGSTRAVETMSFKKSAKKSMPETSIKMPMPAEKKKKSSGGIKGMF